MAENDNKNNKNLLNNKSPQGKPRFKFNFYWIYGILAIAFIAIQFLNFDGTTREINENKFREALLKRDVDKIKVINKEFAEVYIKKERIKEDTLYKNLKKKGVGGSYKETFYTYKFNDYKEEFLAVISDVKQELYEQDTVGVKNPDEHKTIRANVDKLFPVSSETRKNWGGEILGWLLPLIILIAFFFIITRVMGRGAGGAGGQIFNIGKSKAQLFDRDSSVTITFKDVAGLEEAKTEIIEIVEFLKNPSKYTELGGKIPKGVLLVGPPGTGKTLLAKAVAGEAKVPFFSISGSEFVEMFVGVGASRVRDLFKQAKEKAPCIIFIDEIDAIGRARGKQVFSGANDERESTLNQLLTEMDGFANNQGVIILAATNRADILDRALLRAGRFDRQINVELPELHEREAIFKVHLRPLKLDPSIDILFLARQTPGFSGADIANVCNEAALIAARKNKKSIEKQDFIDAIDRIVGGLEKRSKIISEHEKRVIAYHESGHASVSWLLEHAHPLVKVTIVPRGKALGAAWYLPEERQITTYEQMFDEMVATLGGRAAEEVVFGKVSTGALNDLERVTKSAYAMVVYFGLNKKIGNLSYYDSTGQQEFSFTRPYSEKTAEVIDSEVHKLIESAYQRAVELIRGNKDKLDQLAHVLLEKEVIFREDLEKIFGKRPFESEREKELDEIAADITQTVTSSIQDKGPDTPKKNKDQDDEGTKALPGNDSDQKS